MARSPTVGPCPEHDALGLKDLKQDSPGRGHFCALIEAPLMTLTSCIGPAFADTAIPRPVRLPAHMPGKAKENGSSA